MPMPFISGGPSDRKLKPNIGYKCLYFTFTVKNSLKSEHCKKNSNHIYILNKSRAINHML